MKFLVAEYLVSQHWWATGKVCVCFWLKYLIKEKCFHKIIIRVKYCQTLQITILRWEGITGNYLKCSGQDLVFFVSKDLYIVEGFCNPASFSPWVMSQNISNFKNSLCLVDFGTSRIFCSNFSVLKTFYLIGSIGDIPNFLTGNNYYSDGCCTKNCQSCYLLRIVQENWFKENSKDQ